MEKPYVRKIRIIKNNEKLNIMKFKKTFLKII